MTAAALNRLTSAVLDGAIRVHRKTGPGLLENAYFACLCYELHARHLAFETQKAVPLLYDGVPVECAYRADFIVERAVIVEVKALDTVAAVHLRQLRTYTTLADCYVGLLLNFGAAMMKDGIYRVVNGSRGLSPTRGKRSAQRRSHGGTAEEQRSAEFRR
jgi:GxxExxY protein